MRRAVRSGSRRREHLENAFARNRCRDPDQRKLRIEPPVEVEDEPIRGEKKRQASRASDRWGDP